MVIDSETEKVNEGWLKPQESVGLKTIFEEFKEVQGTFSNVEVSPDIHKVVMEA